VGDGRNRARRLDESIFADFTPMGRTGAPGCRPATPSSSQPAHVPASHSSRFDLTLLAEQSIDVYVEGCWRELQGLGQAGRPGRHQTEDGANTDGLLRRRAGRLTEVEVFGS
jgi:hypothetical protein